jgi:hypothetical protein
MSGQPYRYVKDIENFRNEYMDSLKLRANIDDMNFQANKIYKETGALPPKSTMKDMRTTGEVLLDVQKLKQDIIGEFKGLATPQMIQLVIQRIEGSPLNGDGSFLVWLAQNVKELVPQLKKKYSYGIAGDANDAENMYLFIQEMYTKTKSMNASLKSSFDRPTNNDSISMGDFDKIKKLYDDIQLRLLSSPNFTRYKMIVRDQLNAINEILRPQAAGISNYNLVRQIFINASAGGTYAQQTAVNVQGYNEIVEYTDKLPSVSVLQTLLDQLSKSVKNADDDLTIQILTNISSMLPPVQESRRIDALMTNIIINQAAGPPPVPPAIAIPPAPVLAPGAMLAPFLGPPAPPAPPPALAGPIGGQVAADANALSTDILRAIHNARGVAGANGGNDGYDFVTPGMIAAANTLALYMGMGANINYNAGQIAQAIQNYTQNSLARVDALINGQPIGAFAAAELPRFNHTVRGVAGYNMIGFGMHKRSGRPRGSGIVKPIYERIDKTQGIKQGHTHVPFGKYIINKNRLDDDIFSFKHVKGYGVKGYPSKKISRNLSNVIKTIIGGGVPKFNELSNLSDDEKNYLHTVSSKAGIMDKLSVPTPSKDTMEQDVHQFNVMKGEILAGNDSSVLIKKFKLLLLKLSKNGSLPKRECQEIMEDLIQLGY